MSEDATAPGRCANCEATLAGPWCHRCGQSVVEPGARRMRVLLGQFIEAMTDLDSRFWRSLAALMLQPGRLSREWLEGRRQRWMPPMALFLLATVLYFIAPGLTDFQLPFDNQVSGQLRLQLIEAPEQVEPERLARIADAGGQPHSRWTSPLVERKLAARQRGNPDYRLRDLADAYDRRSGEVSKLLVIVHLPLVALALALLMWRQRMLFADHFVVAIHAFTFLLLLIQVLVPLSLLVSLLGGGGFPTWAKLSLAALVISHFGIAIRRVYGVSLAWALPAGGALLVLVGLGSVLLFRPLQFLLVLALI